MATEDSSTSGSDPAKGGAEPEKETSIIAKPAGSTPAPAAKPSPALTQPLPPLTAPYAPQSPPPHQPSEPKRPLTPATGPTLMRTGIRERAALSVSGWFGVLVLLGCGYFAVRHILDSVKDPQAVLDNPVTTLRGLGIPLLIFFIVASSLVVIAPMETRVLQFFGKYIGTVRRTGLVWTVPFTTRRSATVRVRNFETRVLKVNDAAGNPVEFAAVVVWQVRDTARAVFAVDNASEFVTVQAEAALRHVAVSHPYDDTDGQGSSLRGSTDLVAEELAAEVGERVAVAGVQVLEVRISHLAYAPEIAQAMLQRQQAAAIVAARTTIVDGAVGMVELALARLERNNVVHLDDERKAQMVSNLLVVLCGDSRATPVVNTGTLYQ